MMNASAVRRSYHFCRSFFPILSIALLAGHVSASDLPLAKPGLLIMAHGGTVEWNAAVEEGTAHLRQYSPVALAFGMAQQAPLEEAIRHLEDQGVNRIAVVRLFVSPESFRHQTEYLLGLRPDPPSEYLLHHPQAHHHGAIRILGPLEAPPPIETKSKVVISREGLYDSEEARRILFERVRALSKIPSSESVLILAHGEGDDLLNRTWLSKLQQMAEQVREAAHFREIRVETLREDWPEKRAAAEERIRRFVRNGSRDLGRVIVVPFRVHGFGSYADVLRGLDYVRDGRGLLPHPLITRWVERQAEDCFERMGVASPFPKMP